MALAVEKAIREKIGSIKGSLNNSMLVQLNRFDHQLLIEEPTTLETTDGETFDFSPMTKHMAGLYEKFLQGATEEDAKVEPYETPSTSVPEAGSAEFKSRFGQIRTVNRGALEVYFCGVRLFSKIQSKYWPNAKMVAEKAAHAYQDFIDGKDITVYETLVGFKESPDMNMQIAMMQSSNNGFDIGEQVRFSSTAPGGFGTDSNFNVHDHANQENAKCTDENCEYMIRGRQICLGECKFVFERVWKVTC